MTANAEPIFWPEPLNVIEEEEKASRQRRILQFRHRIGECDVTHLILDSREEADQAER